MKLRARASASLLGLALACGRPAEDPAKTEPAHELDESAIRASALAGLEAATADLELATEVGLARALDQPDVEIALERLLARLGADPALTEVSDRLFAEVQDGPGIRTSLAEYARANPELDITALTEGFVAHVDERLTRPAIASAIEATLRSELEAAELPLARALMIDAGGAERLVSAILVVIADPEVRARLEEHFGADPVALEQRIRDRLAEPARAGWLVARLGPPIRSKLGTAVLVAIVDHEQTATVLAAALARVLADVDVRERCEVLFTLALAEDLDARAFERELRAVVHEPIVVREAGALLDALARAEFVGEQVAKLFDAVVEDPEFTGAVLDTLLIARYVNTLPDTDE